MTSKDLKVVSVHSYITSHDTGYEALMRQVAKEEGIRYEGVIMPGHGPRGAEDFRPTDLTTVIASTTQDLVRMVDENTIIAGASFGSYPGLMYLHRGKKPVRGAIFTKPMVDLTKTLSIKNEALEPHRKTLGPEKAIRTFPYGTKKRPFQLYRTPTLILPGTNDQVVGDEAFMRERIQGKNISFQRLRGPHNDYRPKDMEKAEEEIRTFLKRVKRAEAA